MSNLESGPFPVKCTVQYKSTGKDDLHPLLLHNTETRLMPYRSGLVRQSPPLVQRHWTDHLNNIAPALPIPSTLVIPETPNIKDMEHRYKGGGKTAGQNCVAEVWIKRFHRVRRAGDSRNILSANGEILIKMNLPHAVRT